MSPKRYPKTQSQISLDIDSVNDRTGFAQTKTSFTKIGFDIH